MGLPANEIISSVVAAGSSFFFAATPTSLAVPDDFCSRSNGEPGRAGIGHAVHLKLCQLLVALLVTRPRRPDRPGMMRDTALKKCASGPMTTRTLLRSIPRTIRDAA